MLLLLLLEHYVCTKISNNICIDSLHFETIIRIWGRIRYHLLSSVPTKSHSYRNNWNDHYWNYTRATNNFGNFHNTSTFPKLAKFSFIPSITVTTIEPMNELLLGMTKNGIVTIRFLKTFTYSCFWFSCAIKMLFTQEPFVQKALLFCSWFA